MNAQQQHSHYSQQIEALISRAEALSAVPNTEAYSMTLARNILSDLKLKLDAYQLLCMPSFKDI